MKKLLTLLFVLPFLFASCSDNDDHNNVSSDQLVGSWLFQKTYVEELKTNSNIATQAIKDDVEADGRRTEEIWTFYEDGTMELQFDKTDVLNGYYTLDGNFIKMKLYDEYGKLDEVIAGKISLSKNILNFHFDATEVYQYEIDELLPGDVDDIKIYSVQIVDSYKRIN